MSKINWQEEDAKGNVLGAVVAGIGCLLPMVLIMGLFLFVALFG